jgi:hypothetical protein
VATGKRTRYVERVERPGNGKAIEEQIIGGLALFAIPRRRLNNYNDFMFRCLRNNPNGLPYKYLGKI